MYKSLIITIIIILAQSCSFYSFKGSIPAHIKSVVISPIINNTSEYTVSTLLDEKFTNMILLENILNLQQMLPKVKLLQLLYHWFIKSLIE